MSNNSNPWQKLVKWIKYGSKVVSILTSILSLGLGIFSAVVAANPNQPITLEWRIIILIIIFNSLFLIGATIYECVFFILSRGAIKSKIELEQRSVEKLKEKDKKIEELKLHSDYLINFTSALTKKLHLEFDNIIRNNDSFQNKIYTFKKWKAQSESPQVQNEHEVAILKEEDEYKKQLIKSFNEFLGVCVNDLKDCIDKILLQKGQQLKSSIAIKLLNDEYYGNADYNELKVITAFRDRITYNDNKREVKKKVYYVKNNSDFLQCLSKDYFLQNNIPNNQHAYVNENLEFYKFYNCAIVVPIFYSDSTNSANKCYFGYLTCDTLNSNPNNDNIFDLSMVSIMQFVAHVIGAYLDNIDYQWDAVLDTLSFEFAPEDLLEDAEDDDEDEVDTESFLSIIYKMKAIGLKGENK